MGGTTTEREGGRDGAMLLLGIDTGGTFTDAVLIDSDRLASGPAAVLAKAKRLTTHGDLARGIAAAVAAVLETGAPRPGRVGLVSLSTTLATNALVEGQGGRAALVLIGFGETDAARHGLAEALAGDPLIRIAGGHDAHGAEAAALDLAALEAALAAPACAGIEAVAVCGLFGVRNPAHERAARALIRERTGLPVTCAHELSPRVGGPRRALTALLNARLTGLIDRLIGATGALLAEAGIAAPLMVVRGDGALVSAAFARARPIETILSGPAASLVGAGWLTGLADAVVSDIGGTTTDIAVLRDGRPRLDPDGATVGGHRTMVEAVAMATHGLGGDSELGLSTNGIGAALTLGPRRAIPLSLLATEHPGLVHATLARQGTAGRVEPSFGRFLVARAAPPPGLAGAEAELMERLAAAPLPEETLATERRLTAAARRLAARGLVRPAALTPSDAAHVLGLQEGWDRAAAETAAALFARRRGPSGQPVAEGARALAQAVLRLLARRSAEHVLEAALAEDGFPEAGLAQSALAAAALDGRAGLVRPRADLTVPLVGLGAGAATHYPGVARLLGAPCRVPEHADVANAVGAVVGGVQITRRGVVSAPDDGRFRAHLPEGPRDFAERAAAEAALVAALGAAALADAEAAGADAPDLAHRIERREAMVEGRAVFVEATVTVIATGRPRLATAGEAAPRP